MTYRQDSDIVHAYGRYVPRHLSHTIRDHQAIDFYLSPKDNQSTFDVPKEFQTRQSRILWIVSNCNTPTRREQVAEQLRKHFPIDQYGQCSASKKNSRRIPAKDFERMLFNYKFYIAFENAHCEDYITEKAFYNSFAHGSIPIILGPSEQNCKAILPPESFVHVNHFDDMQELADALTRASKYLPIYETYHQWRLDYRLIVWPSNYYLNDRFCDLCTKLHTDHQPKSYANLSQWLNRCH